MFYPPFARHYLEKSAALAETFGAQHAEEVSLRANYQSKLKKHFLSKMFPGMEDTPPAFATSPPRYGHWFVFSVHLFSKILTLLEGTSMIPFPQVTPSLVSVSDP